MKKYIKLNVQKKKVILYQKRNIHGDKVEEVIYLLLSYNTCFPLRKKKKKNQHKYSEHGTIALHRNNTRKLMPAKALPQKI